MNDDPAELQRQAAYLEPCARRAARAVRRLRRLPAGVLILVVGRYRLGGAPWLLWAGVA